jgi:hypothetical protein
MHLETVKMMRFLSVLFTASILAGCGGEQPREFVIYRDVPANPSVTIVPMHRYSLKDNHLALETEKKFVALGIQILNRPPEHDEVVTTESNRGPLNASEQKIDTKAKAAMIEQRFSNILDIKSTFVILVDSDTETMRTVRMDGQQIVSVISYRDKDSKIFGDDTTRQEVLRGLVESLGFKTKQ